MPEPASAEPFPTPAPVPAPVPRDWKSMLAADLRALALRRPWGQALMAIGWVHLGFFLVCHAVYTVGNRSALLALTLWSAEVFAVFWAMRRVAGRDWIRESPTVLMVVRVWITFLIVSFNVLSLNHLEGWSVDWFKPVWCTLASFAFATMAWLFGYRLLIPAVQMYFTGLLMVRFPSWNYVIHGLSWCVLLQYLGWDLIRQRARLRAKPEDRARSVEPAPNWRAVDQALSDDFPGALYQVGPAAPIMTRSSRIGDRP